MNRKRNWKKKLNVYDMHIRRESKQKEIRINYKQLIEKVNKNEFFQNVKKK